MKRNKKVELPDNLELCDDCGFEKKRMQTCSCGKRVCDLCLDFHSDEHYYEQNGGEPQ